MHISRARLWAGAFCALVILTLSLVSRASAGTGTWTSGGPEGGLVRAITASPNFAQDNTVFSAAQNRGILKSTDRGETWAVSNRGMGNADVRSIKVSPDFGTDRTVFAGALGGGMYRSRDAGQNWTVVNNGLTSGLVWAIALSPQYPADPTLFAATNDAGVFRSVNGGDSWIQANTGLTLTSFLAIAVSPDFDDDRIVLAGAQGGIFRSVDGGLSWTWASNGINRVDIRRIVFSPNFEDDGVVFVGTERGGVFKSTDRGQSWSDPANGGSPPDVSDMAISPNFANDQTLYASNDTYGYSRSTDGGLTWVRHISLEWVFPYSTNVDGLSIAVSPEYGNDGIIWVGTIGSGIFRTQNFGQTWQLLRTGYYAIRGDRVHVSPSYASDHTVFTLALGGGALGSNDGGQSWHSISGRVDQRIDFGMTMAVAASPAYASDRTLFVSYAKPYWMVRSRDGGANWERADSGLTSWDLGNIAVSPNYAADGTVFAVSGSGGIFRSTNQGVQWSAVNSGLSSLRTTNVALSPGFAGDRVAFVTTDGGGVFKSTNGGSSWQAVNSGLTTVSIRDIALSPNFPTDQTLYVASNTGIFKSLNGGASWALCMTSYSLKAIAVSPYFTTDSTIYAGGSSGVMRSVDRGATWTDISSTLGHTGVTDLSVGGDAAGHTLFASTLGGSVWQYSSAGAPPATSTPTVTPPLGSATRTATATLPAAGTPTATRTPTRTAQAATPTATIVPSANTWRINCGGIGYVDTTGQTWLGDRGYAPGGAGYTAQGGLYAVSDAIANTDDDPLYQSEHFNPGSYRFDVPNGEYTVDLHFAEIWTPKIDGRIFDVIIQGQVVLRDFNILALTTRLSALRYSFPAVVTNGTLEVAFVSKVGAAKINAIAVVPSGPPATPTRTATANTTGTTTAVPTATATALPVESAWRINCGGLEYVDGQGRLWLGDRAYSPGSFGYTQQGGLYSVTDAIANTNDDPLYQTEHFNPGSYRFDVPNGSYTVELLFAEIWTPKIGGRVFDVVIQGRTVLPSFDVLLTAGSRLTALRYSFPASVTDGKLVVAFIPKIGAPKINAIGVTATGAAATATVTAISSATATAVVQSPTSTPTATGTGVVQSPTSTPTATTTALPVGSAWRINAGGPRYTSGDGRVWQADQAYTPGGSGYVGGRTYSAITPIANTTDDTLYQTEHWGMEAYKFDVPNGLYRVELLFDELYDPHPNGRVFDVKIQGQTVLSNFCPLNVAGERFVALRYTYQATVNNGQLSIEFVAKVGAPKINAIAVEALGTEATPTATLPAGTPPVTPTATATNTATATSVPGGLDIAVNCGSTAYLDRYGVFWRSDQAYAPGGWGYVGGGVYSTNYPIAGTDDDVLYLSERWGMSAYRFTVPPGTYTVQLRFAEIYGWQAGQRIFDVDIEGQTALPSLDIFAEAGRFAAYDRAFTVQVADGILDIGFVKRVNNAKINAIRVTRIAP